MKNITVVGSGYVGLSIGVLLSQKSDVTILDIDSTRIDLINNKKATIEDSLIEKYLLTKNLNLKGTLDKEYAYTNADIIVLATPTNYDESVNRFDTSILEECIEDAVKLNNDALVVIKSTIPIGFTDLISSKLNTKNIVFSPEFLREGKALYDNLYPSRIVIGGSGSKMFDFSNMLQESAIKKEVPVLSMSSREAESVKLFSNTYLAMRVAYFNELDSFCEVNDLSSKAIIDAISLDDRIGSGYNNPSFGYGGYCLPKDTKQLKENFRGINESLISAIIESNDKRISHVFNQICSRNPKSVGFYRLTMKKDSDNIRSSASSKLMDLFAQRKIKIFLYEPSIKVNKFNVTQLSSVESFIENSEIVVTNRNAKDLVNVKNIYTRDIYNVD